jgi:tRNA pseudouridine55 synthase
MPIAAADLDAVLGRFVGAIEQVPPMVSAVKVGGRRLHELARRGEQVERAPRPVRIDELTVETFEPGPYPRATVHVECSSGTYVRTLADDLGTALGGCAHLATLRRLRVGPFTLSDAHVLEEIEADAPRYVLSPADAMRGLPRVDVTGETARAIAHGATFSRVGLVDDSAGPGPFAVVSTEGGELLAIYERTGAGVKPAVVLVTADP